MKTLLLLAETAGDSDRHPRRFHELGVSPQLRASLQYRQARLLREEQLESLQSLYSLAIG